MDEEEEGEEGEERERRMYLRGGGSGEGRGGGGERGQVPLNLVPTYKPEDLICANIIFI